MRLRLRTCGDDGVGDGLVDWMERQGEGGRGWFPGYLFYCGVEMEMEMDMGRKGWRDRVEVV